MSQNRPLCNVGLVMKSHSEGTLSMMLGAWLIFTETYTSILETALTGPKTSASIEWVDDAFFGYICSAKVCCSWAVRCHTTRILTCCMWSQDMLGQATSILTSSVGAGIVAGHKQMLRRERASQAMGTGSSGLQVWL